MDNGYGRCMICGSADNPSSGCNCQSVLSDEKPDILGVGIYPAPVPDKELGKDFRIIRYQVRSMDSERPALEIIPLGNGREFVVRNQFDLTEVIACPSPPLTELLGSD